MRSNVDEIDPATMLVVSQGLVKLLELITTISGRAGSIRSPAGQPDGLTIAQGANAFQAHVASALDGPFVILFEQDSA